MNQMHIYGQEMWHDDVSIIGDTASLTALKKAIEDALETGSGFALAFVNDGEGFNTLVVRVDDAGRLDNLAVPYMDDMAKERDADADWPHTIQAIKDAYWKADAAWKARSEGVTA